MLLRPRRILSSLLLHLCLVYADSDAPCYLPSGTKAPGFFPCDATAYITSCCPTGWTCYSNSMCVITDPSTANSSYPVGTSMRGTCTNPEWNNAVCGDFCLTDRDISGDLKACGDNKFCCADDASCSCSNGAFHLNPGRVQTIIGVQGLEHTETSTIPVSASTAHLTSSTTFITSATSANSEGQTPAATAQAASKKAIDKPGVKAGIAFGVILGVALLVGVGWLIYRRFFSGYRLRPRENDEPKPIDELPKPFSPEEDPYRPGNAANIGFPPVIEAIRESQDHIHRDGDAPYGNEYERNAPSRAPFVSSNTTVGTGTLDGGYNGTRGTTPRPLSFISNDEAEAAYGQPRVGELGI